jgi:hypothetical protein
VPERQLKELFCERFDCPPSEYEERAFRKCLYLHARPLAPLIRLISPNFFAEDFKFMRYLGDSTSLREVRVDRMNFHDANRSNPKFLRTALRIRVSGRKATRLAQRLYAEMRASSAQ